MANGQHSDSRALLGKLREALAGDSAGQERLDRVTELITEATGREVCSIYLFRDAETLELCATEGLNKEAVHQTRLRIGEGLVGRVARSKQVINSADAPSERGFRFMAETGEEVFPAFLGVPIQRLGETLGVLVVQSREARPCSDDSVYAMEIVAMVLAEMAELGAFVGEGAALSAPHQHPVSFTGSIGQEGAAMGHVWLHEPRVVVTNPIADDPAEELAKLTDAVETLRVSVDELLATASTADKEQMQVLEAYRMFANSKGWMRRMEADIASGLSAAAAVEKEQSTTRARMDQVPDPYLRERLHDLDDLSNRLLRILTGQGGDNSGAEMPADPVIVANNIGPAELLEYGRNIKGIVLEEGSVASHAAVVARAFSVPLIVHAGPITAEALNGDLVLIDSEHGTVHLRPEESVVAAFRDKMAMEAAAQERYVSLRDKPAQSPDGVTVELSMNAGLMADLPSLETSGAAGVGLFRTELQFLTVSQVPKRGELAALYSRVLDRADDKRVVFRTLDIGSDKVLPYMKPTDEPNPALGWRAIRVGLDKPGVMRMQLQALIRAAAGRRLSVMFPFIAQLQEFRDAREILMNELEKERRLGHILPKDVEVGAMLETPSMVFAPRPFFEEADFISIGGNDLKQFFYAADRENERVRRRYDTLNTSFLNVIEQIIARCDAANTPVSYCGEDAGRPVEAACFAAIGMRKLSMRPASIGPVKHLIRRTNLSELRKVIDTARDAGEQSVRPAVNEFLYRRRGK
ncbi:MAG: phosphoenolpyruvate--protein phosphotransferase [Rhodobacterales bacterium]|nr:MAG: phosphoenolpyruvate--protein phosphotransferase [Rhodobacterales bacterium]